MSFNQIIMPNILAGISSQTLKASKRFCWESLRRVKGSPHQLDVFLKIDDPYSFLLVQVLEDLVDRFAVEINLHTVVNLQEDMFPEKQMWNQNAFVDSKNLADLYQLDFPLSQIEVANNDAISQQLVEIEKQKNSLKEYKNIFYRYWLNRLNEDTVAGRTASQKALQDNEKLLKKLGHYFSAMIHYGGEWYWGLDRLDHLERRLLELDAQRDENASVKYDLTWKHLFLRPSDVGKKQALEIFFSARSPYSYLGLEQAAKLATHHDISLIIKPVLPMVMRGMKVPDSKKMYIFLDTKREAEKLGLPYGRVADPVGHGVERCYALFEYAKSEGKALEYLLSFTRRVNAEGVRSETDAGLRAIVEQAGLTWNKAKPLLEGCHQASAKWRIWAQQNLDELFSAGLWGVPSFRYGDLNVWGQDRLWQIEQEIANTK